MDFRFIPSYKISSDLIDKLNHCLQSVDKPKFLFLRRKRRIYVFPLTGAAEKHLVSEKPPIQRFFKGTGVVLAEHNNRLPPVAD